MAHFAQLDENNFVIRTISVNDNDCLDDNGQESEAVGQSFCVQLFGESRWVQTSYNRTIRRNFAGSGMYYHQDKDVFVSAPPKPWFFLNDQFEWECPFGINPGTGLEVTEQEWTILGIAYSISPDYNDFNVLYASLPSRE